MKTIQSIDKTVAVLDALAAAPHGRTLTELAQELDMTLSTLHGFVTTLRRWNLLHKDEETGRLFLGSRILRLAGCCDRQQTLIRLIRPKLTVLVEKYDETVHMAIPDGEGILYLDKKECRRPFRMTSMVGMRETFFQSAIGLVLAANLPGTTKTAAEKKMVKKTGDGRTAVLFHPEIELYCLAVALFNVNDEAIAGLSVAVPKCRFDKTLQKAILDDLLTISDELHKET